MALCRFMRWKSFYGQDWNSEAELLEVLNRNEVPYYCLQTSQPWGPDDDAAVPERCGRHRTCFEPSPLFPEPTLV